MAEESYPFVATPVATKLQWSRMARLFQVDGVVSDDPAGTSLRVTANGTAQVTVAAGEGFVNGFYYRNSTDKLVTVPANGGGTARNDRIVARSSMTGDSVLAVHSQGGSSLPALTQNRDDVYEIPLAHFTVAAGSAVVQAISVIDDRYFVGKPARPSSGNRPAPLRGQFLVEGTSSAPVVLVGTGTAWVQVYPSPTPAWLAAGLAAGWANYGSGFEGFGYTKLPGGLVKVQGLIKATVAKAASVPMFTLPVGYRPANTNLFITLSQSAAGVPTRLDLQDNGIASISQACAAGDWVSLFPIHFVSAG